MTGKRQRNATARYRNITVDREVHEQLVAVQAKLKDELGFEPSLSQTVRAIIKRATL
jgi:hypothetical protein